MHLTNMYTSAIIENNNGVIAMEAGDYESARMCFRRALNVIIEAVRTRQLPPIGRPSLHWSENAPLCSNQRKSLKKEDTATVSHLPFVYRRAIVIVTDSTHWYDNDQQYTNMEYNYAEESSAIVFNLALSCHLFALSENRSEILQRAVKFYEIANEIRQKNCLHMDIIDLALINNVGQAQHEFCNYGLACQCFGMMLNRLKVLNNEGLVYMLSQCDRDGFLMNGMLEQPTIAAAA